jgi:hypothetical protein
MASHFGWTIAIPTTRTSGAWQSVLRAFRYLSLADEVGVGEWDAFKDHLATAIVWGRATLNHLEEEHRKQPGFREWFDGLYQQHPILLFFKRERDGILKARALAIHGQRAESVGARFVLVAPGEPPPPPPPDAPPPPPAAPEAYFDDPAWRAQSAVDTVGTYLLTVATAVEDAERRVWSAPGSAPTPAKKR